MPTFNDSENKPPYSVFPEGDYIFKTTAFDQDLSKGQKTRGSDQYQFELEFRRVVDGKEECAISFENLIDHPTTAWKLDCFLKAAGIQLKKGEFFEFDPSKANASGALYVNPLGLRGWCKLTREPRQEKQGDKYVDKKGPNGETIWKNRVAVFYTDKPKLAAEPPEVPADEPTPF